jgi:hypothetical protein
MRNLLHNIQLSINPAHLDADLAAGMPPESSPRHAARASHLVTPRTRHALAANWEHLLLISHTPTGGLSNRAPVRRERIHQAEPEILELISALRATGPMPARGVAIAVRLLTDGCGPIYNAKAPDDLTAEVELAVEHLDPALPLTYNLIEPLRA